MKIQNIEEAIAEIRSQNPGISTNNIRVRLFEMGFTNENLIKSSIGGQQQQQQQQQQDQFQQQQQMPPPWVKDVPEADEAIPDIKDTYDLPDNF